MRVYQEEIVESIIPYYISNGKTNMIRSNLLLPFMCFNETLTKDVCPYVANGLSEGGLIKYSMIKHLDNQTINDQITEKKTETSNNRTDVLSFVSRIENVLDFLICLTNYNIINFKEENIKYYYPHSDDVNDSRELNMNIISSIHKNDNDEFKSELLDKLKNLISVFIDQPFFRFTVKDINILKSDVIIKEEYNKQIIHICEKNHINSEADNNVNNYIRISNELYANIFNATIKKLHFDYIFFNRHEYALLIGLLHSCLSKFVLVAHDSAYLRRKNFEEALTIKQPMLDFERVLEHQISNLQDSIITISPSEALYFSKITNNKKTS
jgi:hypothetical protein